MRQGCVLVMLHADLRLNPGIYEPPRVAGIECITSPSLLPIGFKLAKGRARAAQEPNFGTSSCAWP